MIPERPELLELYKVAIEEYRFEVNLQWDRLKHYFIVNAGLTSVGVTLLKGTSDTGGSVWMDVIVAAVFVVGMSAAALGIISLFRSREYYRMTVFKKTLIEHLLGYDQPLDGAAGDHACLAIGTTRGMRRGEEIRQWTESQIRQSRLQIGSLMFYAALALGLAGMIDLFCVGVLFWRNLGPWAVNIAACLLGYCFAAR